MDTINRLRNHLLIATPSVLDISYQHAVIYICEQQAEGSVGLIINKPLSYPLGFIFKHLNIEPISVEQKNRPLLFGGPRQPDRGFVMHRPAGHWESSLLLAEDLAITTSTDIIRAFAANTGPKDALITLGFVGWNSKQLENELLSDNWLVCSYKSELIYEIPFQQRWEYAASLIGVNINNLIEGGGHA
jgi:putative transcriptional regulator